MLWSSMYMLCAISAGNITGVHITGVGIYTFLLHFHIYSIYLFVSDIISSYVIYIYYQ